MFSLTFVYSRRRAYSHMNGCETDNQSDMHRQQNHRYAVGMHQSNNYVNMYTKSSKYLLIVYMNLAANDHKQIVFSARCNVYISRLCYNVSVHLSVRLSVTEVHWYIIANLARSAKLPTGLYILLALISSFSSFFYSERSYLSIYWTNFHDLFTKWKVFA